MADFDHLSYSAAAGELISQAQDLTVLEQLSKLNRSGFTDSVLPIDLETRFRKLKSFPVCQPRISANKDNSRNGIHPNSSSSYGSKYEACSVSDEKNETSTGKVGSFKRGKLIYLDSKQYPEETLGKDEEFPSGYASPPLKSSRPVTGEDIFSCKEEDPEGAKGLKEKFEYGSISSLSDSSNSCAENVLSPCKSESKEKRDSKSRSEHETPDSPHGLSQLSINSPSPPQKAGCFWCSPKRVSKKKSKENYNLGWGDKNDEFLSDLGKFSVKEQQGLLRKAMEEEEKICRESQKILEWAKQASARMSLYGTDDGLSEGDSGK